VRLDQAEGEGEWWVCVPFTGLHLCDLLLHLQGFEALILDSLMDDVSKRARDGRDADARGDSCISSSRKGAAGGSSAPGMIAMML